MSHLNLPHKLHSTCGFEREGGKDAHKVRSVIISPYCCSDRKQECNYLFSYCFSNKKSL